MDKLSYGQFQPTHGIQNVVSILIFILSFLHFFTFLCVYRCMDVLEGGAVQCICGGGTWGQVLCQHQVSPSINIQFAVLFLNIFQKFLCTYSISWSYPSFSLSQAILTPSCIHSTTFKFCSFLFYNSLFLITTAQVLSSTGLRKTYQSLAQPPYKAIFLLWQPSTSNSFSCRDRQQKPLLHSRSCLSILKHNCIISPLSFFP